METHVDEIAEHIYRLSTFVPEIGPTGFTFNQFLVDADEPLLFHTGHAAMFPLVSRGHRARSCRWSGCAGSRSVTSSRTSAAR